MIFHDLVVIGGGMAAMAAVKSFRSEDQVSTIMMISEQPDLPIRKPPLSKHLWKGMPVADCFYNPARFGVEYHPRTSVVEVDFSRHRLTLSNGNKVRYNQLLIATGLQPRRLKGHCEEAVYFNSLADFRRVRQRLSDRSKAVVIGGGLLGVELACSLNANGIQTTLVCAGHAPLTGYLSESMARRVMDRLDNAGVDCICNRRAIQLDPGGRVQLSDGRQLQGDLVLPVIGQQPSIDFLSLDADSSTLGLQVDSQLRVSGLEDVYACGDVARFGMQPTSYRHEENALRSGADAGRSMAGQSVEYRPSSFLYSEFLDLRLESIGVGSAVDMKAIGEDWSDSESRGICIFTEDDLVRRVSLVNYRMDADTADMFSSRLIGQSAEDDQLQIVRTVLKSAA